MASFDGRIGSNENLSNILNVADPIKSYEQDLKKIIDLNTKYNKLSLDEINKYKANLEKKRLQDEKKEYLKLVKDVEKTNQSAFKRVASEFAKNLKNALASSVGHAIKSLSNGIDAYIQTYTKYMGSINTRLQGTALSFDKISKNVATNLGTSPYLRQEDMLSNINKFVESGISYNLESRAYVATATAKIANTFNAFDSSLLRLIRIQQADSTVARLGMESLLTKFLNARYEDTSYLNTLSSNVTANLLEAESLMGYKGATNFEYAVQKWLGSMSSLGVSDSTINMISQGLGYLGSGNYSALLGNEGLRNLFGMAASSAGTDLGSLLTGGLNAQTTSALLSQIVGIGQNVAKSKDNVTLSAYANLFGLSVSDIVSLTNLTAKDLKEISNNIVNYEGMRQETVNQLGTISQRTTTSEKVQNVLENIKLGLGANIATSPAAYAVWEAANLLSGSGLDYQIKMSPFGVGIDTSFSQLMKTGVLGISAITSISNAIGALKGGNLSGTSLSVWGEKETRGGRGLGEYSSGRTISGASYVGNLDSSNIKSALNDVQSDAQTYQGEEQSETADIARVVSESIAPNVQSILTTLESWENRFSSSNLSRLLGTY